MEAAAAAPGLVEGLVLCLRVRLTAAGATAERLHRPPGHASRASCSSSAAATRSKGSVCPIDAPPNTSSPPKSLAAAPSRPPPSWNFFRLRPTNLDTAPHAAARAPSQPGSRQAVSRTGVSWPSRPPRQAGVHEPTYGGHP